MTPETIENTVTGTKIDEQGTITMDHGKGPTLRADGSADFDRQTHIDANGNVTGEFRIVGLFTSTAYHALVHDVPLLRTDAYGRFIPGANGFAQIITGAGVDGVFMETHEDPSRALSDGPNAYRLDRMKRFLTHLVKVHALAQERS